jgi:DNA-binding NarL/FixJ family response regulator
LSSARRLRVICVDDSAETRAVFALVLRDEAGLEVLPSLSSAHALEQSIAETQPDVVVLDLWIPGQDTLGIMSMAKATFPHVHFLVLSSDDDPKQIQRAMSHGASGFALKDGDFERLFAAIRKVAGGEKVRPVGGYRSRGG